MAKTLSRRSLTAEARVLSRISQSVHMIFVVEKSGTGTGFLLLIQSSPVSFIPPALCINFHPHVALT